MGDLREDSGKTRGARSAALDLPTALKMLGAERIDLLKIDVERAEISLFGDGTRTWLNQVTNIAIELHDVECRKTFFAALEPFEYEVSSSGELTICRIPNQGGSRTVRECMRAARGSSAILGVCDSPNRRTTRRKDGGRRNRVDGVRVSAGTTVVHLVPALFDSHDGIIGGAERYVLELARHMAEVVPTRLVTFGTRARKSGSARCRCA